MRPAYAIDCKHGWRRANLGDVAEFVMGQAPPGSASNFEGEGTVFVKAGEFGVSHPIIREWTTKPLRFARSGDVLICVVGATAGKLNLAIDCAIGRSVAAIRPSQEILDKFLYLQLRPKVNDLRAASMGSAQGVINKQMLANIEVVIPPIDEQREIVAEIEKQFTRLEAGVAGLRRVQANLKRYGAAVLKAACEGKLVLTEAELARQEGRTYETGAQLLDRILTERREKWSGKGKYKEPTKPDPTKLPTVPEGWTWASLESITNALGGYAFESKRFSNSGFQVLKMANIRMSRIDLSQRPSFISEVDQELIDKYELLDGDVVVTLTGSRKKEDYGYVASIKNAESLLLNQRIARLRCTGGILPAFLEIAMQSKDFRKRFFSYETGNVGQGNVGMTAVTKESILIPPLAEQQRIVGEVERRLSVVEELETVVNASLQRATRLRQSILQKAFEGRLVQRKSDDDRIGRSAVTKNESA